MITILMKKIRYNLELMLLFFLSKIILVKKRTENKISFLKIFSKYY